LKEWFITDILQTYNETGTKERNLLVEFYAQITVCLPVILAIDVNAKSINAKQQR